ncbi:MAG: hypothetical protein HQ488_05115 [Parcubacteria group bacterium]|nr:hypothetical protein [Parcubacteria group bacterium]
MHMAIGLLAVLYLVSARLIGLPLAKLSWDIWDGVKRDHPRAKFFFPISVKSRYFGNDYFAWSLLMSFWHGEFSGNGFGVMNPGPRARAYYFFTYAMTWPIDVAINVTLMTVFFLYGVAARLWNSSCDLLYKGVTAVVGS